MTRSTATLTLATKTGTVDTGLPVVVNILLGQRSQSASRTFASDYPGRGGVAPVQIPKPANAKELVGFQPDNASDLRPPPRWGINE